MQRIGLLGGTFDPVHNGHIELAMRTAHAFSLNKVIFIPAFHPPHKRIEQLTDFDHRVAMLKLATAGDDNLGVSTVEKEMHRPTYTIDTLNHFLRNRGEKSELFFIIGIDAFLEIRSWKSYGEILASLPVIVASRQGYKEKQFTELLRSFGYVREGSWWCNPNSIFRIYYLDIKICDASSSNIRKTLNLAREERLKGVVPEPVIGYILHNNLYM